MLKDLIPSEDSLLHKKIEKCSYNLDRQEISDTLRENMFHHKGAGLSANQIGIDEEETIICFNPRIIKESKDEVVMEEGCLSYPDKFLDIKRPSSIVVKYEDEEKVLHKVKMTGYTARIFQHEYDHMEGIAFTQRV